MDSPIDENTFILDGHSLIRADHSGNMKRGGVFLYFKENLSLRHVKTKYCPQCLLCRISVQNQNGYLVVRHRSPSQYSNEFNEFLTNFERLFKPCETAKINFFGNTW